jgi:pathogenesis-related protein 1
MYKKVSVTITTTLVIAAILTVSWSALQRSHAQTNGNMADTILQIHNNERAAVGVAPLTWSASLAADAQSYAEHLNSLGYSCCRVLLPHSNTGEGENLAWGTPGYSPAAGAQSWANEKRNYHGEAITQWRPGDPVTGHYTQMVWRSTTQVGCGTSSSDRMDILVCRYNPGGNYLGQTPY